MDLPQQNLAALGDESFTSKEQDMQASADEDKHESNHDLLLTQPFAPIFSSVENRLELKLLEEVDALMEEPLSGKNYNVATHEQEIIHNENIEPQYQMEMSPNYVPTEIPLTRYELVDINREMALQKSLKANPFMGFKDESV